MVEQVEVKDEEVVEALKNKYDAIKQLVAEYNNLARESKMDSRVGCIINENAEGDEYDDESSFDYEGWLPSSATC